MNKVGKKLRLHGQIDTSLLEQGRVIRKLRMENLDGVPSLVRLLSLACSGDEAARFGVEDGLVIFVVAILWLGFLGHGAGAFLLFVVGRERNSSNLPHNTEGARAETLSLLDLGQVEMRQILFLGLVQYLGLGDKFSRSGAYRLFYLGGVHVEAIRYDCAKAGAGVSVLGDVLGCLDTAVVVLEVSCASVRLGPA